MPTNEKKNPHEGHRERLRAQVRKSGLDNMHPHQILEMILFTAIKRKDTNELAHDLLSHCGGLKEVFTADIETLTEVKGIGQNTAVYLKALFETYAQYGGYQNAGHIYLSSPLVMDAFYSSCFRPENGDQLAVTTVDGSLAMVSNRVIKYTTDPTLSVGLIRDVFTNAYSTARHRCILAQYSPRHDVTDEDKQAAYELINALVPTIRIHEFVFLRSDGIKECIEVE